MLMKRRQFVQAGLGLMAGAGAVALAGCGGGQTSGGGDKQAAGKVYYLNFKPEQDAQWQELAELYTEETGVPVTVMTAASGQYETTLKSEMAKTDAPTLFQVNGPVGLASWKDYCYDLDDTEIMSHLTKDDYALKGDETIRHIPISEQFADSLWKVYNAITSLANPKSDIGISSLAGPVDIGRLIYRLSYTGIMAVLSFTVLLNINLAVLNMLPIPVLDGGHIVFAIIEKLRGKPLPAAVFAGIQTAFSLMFLALMGYVVYIGFARWDGDNAREKQSEIYNQYYEKIKF